MLMGMERVRGVVWGVWGVPADGKYMGHRVSEHEERAVHSMGYVRSGDECPCGVGCRDAGGS